MEGSQQSGSATGVYAAIATPRTPGSIDGDAAALLEYVDAIVRSGVNGLVLFGSTGEFVHFDTAERMRLLVFAARRSRIPILVNVSHSTLAGAVDLAEHVIEVGAAGILLMPPYFYRYDDDQIARFYEQFVQHLGGKLPVYLYNLPAFTNEISPQLAARLLSSGAFAGIKDSSGEWQNFESLNSLDARRSFKLLIGNESLYLRARAAGADGIVSGIAAALPELLVAMDEALSKSEVARAQQLNTRLEEFIAWVRKLPTNVGIKQTAVARGWKHEGLAVPLDQKNAEKLNAFRRWLDDWMPDILSECARKSAFK